MYAHCDFFKRAHRPANAYYDLKIDCNFYSRISVLFLFFFLFFLVFSFFFFLRSSNSRKRAGNGREPVKTPRRKYFLIETIVRMPAAQFIRAIILVKGRCIFLLDFRLMYF